jgi:hypothetical protein
LTPAYSILTNASPLAETTDTTTNILAPNSVVGSIYCNGSRLPVEAVVAAGAYGWQVPPGTNESNGLPAPPFTLSAAATVDEGNNWINLRWGPLSLNFANPQTGIPVFTFNPSPSANSAAIDKVPVAITHPATDFFGNARPDGSGGNTFDIGAIESITAAPVAFSLQGGTYNTPHSLTLTDSTPGATIYYTTDGSTPSSSSTKYTVAITINFTGLVQAIAYAPGYLPSAVTSKSYTYVSMPPAAAPAFSLQGGTYNSPQSLTLTDTTPGAVIYYTTDGVSPTTGSTVYNGAITIASTEQVQAVAIASGYSISPVSSKSYTYVPLTPAAAPAFSLAGGTYTTPQTLILTDTTPGAVIRYTTNGSTPTAFSTRYTGAITVASTELVQAIAIATGYSNSPISSKSYTYTPLPPAAAPVFSLAGGIYNTPQTLTLTDTTPGAVIHYTTNGSTPTALSPTYTTSITVASTELVQAIAVATGYSNSPVGSKFYTYVPLPKANAPAFSLAGGHYTTPQSLTLTDTTPGATIYYTTDGSTPTTASTKYVGAITVSTSETVIAIAAAPGYSNSNPSAKAYTIP